MKIGKLNFTLKNIHAFTQANIRMLGEKHGIEFLTLPSHIKEQIVFREAVAKPECKSSKECLCGCPIPDLFYADKTCELECYPVMMNEDEWSTFKNKIEVMNVVQEYPFPKLWMTNKVYSNNSVMPILNSIDFGVITNSGPKSKTTVRPRFYNNSSSSVRVTSVSTSCGCTNVVPTLSIEPGKDGELVFSIDGSKRKPGEASIIASVSWSNGNVSQVTFTGTVENVIEESTPTPPFTIYLDAGHGGVDANGRYTTAPSKMFNHRRGTFHAGSLFYEGVSNRLSLSLVKPLLESNGFRVVVVSDDVRDTSLVERTNRANSDFRNGGRPGLLVSFHSNAVAAENAGRARGFCVFTSVGNTRSDEVATVMYEEYQKQFPGSRVLTQMSDGDPDFEANFHMLSQSAMPAVLIENLFFDNFDDATLLINNNYQSQFAQVVLRTCVRARNIEYGIR